MRISAEARANLRRLIQGDLASLRVVIGLAVIWAIFQFENDRFLSAQNLTNLMLQITAIGLISVGIVYVLLLGEPKLVVLDEPTAALGVAQTAQVLELVKRLRERGLGVLVISHNLVDVFEVADRIFVLRLGRPAGDFKAEQTTEEHVVSAITGVGKDNGGNEDNGEKKDDEG